MLFTAAQHSKVQYSICPWTFTDLCGNVIFLIRSHSVAVSIDHATPVVVRNKKPGA